MTLDQIHIEVLRQNHKLSDEEIEIVLKTARLSRAYMCGVDPYSI